MEEFLNGISLRHLSFVDLGTCHINTASVRFKAACQTAGQLAWLPSVYSSGSVVDVVIEQQGSLHSPINHLCHCMHGVFLGMQLASSSNMPSMPNTAVVYIDYPAAAKFRGDWVLVPPRDGVRFDFKGCGTSDPVKRAAVEACERIMTYFRRSPAFTAMLDRVVAERRTHDMCDCVLQGVSYLFRRHVQKCGSTVQRAQTSLTLPINDADAADHTTELLLGQPRKGRSKAGTRTTTVRSKAVKRKQTERKLTEQKLTVPEQPHPEQYPGDDMEWG